MLIRHLAVIALSTAVVTTVQAASTLTVDQVGLVFNQKLASLKKGDRMVFDNHDDVVHNIHIFEEEESEKDLGLQKPGVPLNYTFARSGRFIIRCNIHPSMKMIVTVK